MQAKDLGKTNVLRNSISHQTDTDKIYFYPKDPHEEKYQLLIDKRESLGLKHSNNSKAFIESSKDLYYIYDNVEE